MVLTAFTGDFKVIYQENVEPYLEAIGVGPARRAMAKNANIRLHVTLEGDDHWYVHVTGLKDTKFDFNMGSEFQHETPDGRKVKSTFTADGPNKVVEKEEWDDKVAIHTYEIDSDIMTVTIELGNVRCLRKFQRI